MLDSTATLADLITNMNTRCAHRVVREHLAGLARTANLADERGAYDVIKTVREKAEDIGEVLCDLFGYDTLADVAWDLAARWDD